MRKYAFVAFILLCAVVVPASCAPVRKGLSPRIDNVPPPIATPIATYKPTATTALATLPAALPSLTHWLPTATPPASAMLVVTPIRQRLESPVTLANGSQDYGNYDCSIATIAMALGTFQQLGLLPSGQDVAYTTLIPLLRGARDPAQMMAPDLDVVAQAAGGVLRVEAGWVEPSGLWQVLVGQIAAGQPLYLSVNHGSQLAAGDAAVHQHTVLLVGYSAAGEVTYIDPWDGVTYSMPLDGLLKAAAFEDQPEGKTISYVMFVPQARR